MYYIAWLSQTAFLLIMGALMAVAVRNVYGPDGSEWKWFRNGLAAVIVLFVGLSLGR